MLVIEALVGDSQALAEYMDKLEAEQAWWEEYGYAAHRLAKLCESRCAAIEQDKKTLQLIFQRLDDEEHICNM